MCGCEFNVAGAGGTIAGAVHGHFSSRSDISAIYHSAMLDRARKLYLNPKYINKWCISEIGARRKPL